MKTLITVTRKTTYTSIVEMDDKTFRRLDKALSSDDGCVVGDAEEEVNNLIDPRDWQHDDLDEVEEFKRFKEGK